ncbi:MAG: hypothetical protein AAGI30_05695 [Planctomycetota bacterium]
MMNRSLTAAALLSIAGSLASAQFLATNGQVAGITADPEALFIAPDGSSTLVFEPGAVTGLPAFASLDGLAADDAERRFFATDVRTFDIDLDDGLRFGVASDLYIFSYDDLDNPVTHPEKFRVADFGDPGVVDEDGVADQGVFLTPSGLAYDTTRDVLYAVSVLEPKCPPFGHPDGVYRIDLNTLIATPIVDFADLPGFVGPGTCGPDGDPSTVLINDDFASVGAIDYDELTDRIYFVNETEPIEGVPCSVCQSIFAIDPDDPTGYSDDPANPAGVTRLTALPEDPDGNGPLAPFDDFDGLGAGNGFLLLVTDNANINNGVHVIYDAVNDAYVGSPASVFPPLSSTDLTFFPISSAGAYTPNILAPDPVAGCIDLDDALPTGTLDAVDNAVFFDRVSFFDPRSDVDDDFDVDLDDVIAAQGALSAGCP